MPGIPVGPGTIFYLLAALLMPVVGIGRRIAGSGSAPIRRTGRQAAVALGMGLAGATSFWVFDAVGSRINAHHTGTGILVLSSPLLLALAVLVAMVAVSRVARRLSR